MTEYDDVAAFHTKFGMEQSVGPVEWDDEFLKFRTDFLKEELQEFEDAVAARDHAKAFDAMLDLVYVAIGNAYSMGYPWEDGWREVQRANMSKARADSADDERSKRKHARDVVKPAGWQAPDIEGVLGNWGFRECIVCGVEVARDDRDRVIASIAEGDERPPRAHIFCSHKHWTQWKLHNGYREPKKPIVLKQAIDIVLDENIRYDDPMPWEDATWD